MQKLHDESQKRLVIFDLDGCLADDTWRREFIAGEGKTHDDHVKYHSLASKDDPLPAGIETLNMHVQNNDFIVFCTARPMMIGETTVNWLAKHTMLNKPNAYMLLMRLDGDERDAVTLKQEMAVTIKRYAAEFGLEVVVAYDDLPEVLNMWIANGIAACVLDREGKGHIMPPIPASVPPEVAAMQNGGMVPGEQIAAQDAADGRQRIAGHVAPIHAADKLQAALSTFYERQNTYGPNDVVYAKVMATLFPGGLFIKTEADHRMMLMLMHAVNKFTRFTSSGMKHGDSAHDLINYAAFMDLLAKEHNIMVTPAEVR